jgi:hypothetical protein
MIRAMALSFLLGVTFSQQVQEWASQGVAAAQAQLRGEAYEKLLAVLA